tara:strand:- start:88 stop:1329 length:1242 start_codon:yes stop_codon:yes gene_type:complete
LENFNFIESGLIFGLCESNNYKAFTHPVKDFANHGEAYKFIQKHLDEYKEFPKCEVLLEKFPQLSKDAKDINFQYALGEFKKHVMYRNIISAFSEQKPILREDPKKALSLIMDGLHDVEILHDADVVQYDSGELDRFEEWKEKNAKRELGDGMIGIPTPFNVINSTGMGWQPGDLITAYARPTVGKTWLCCKIAAIAVEKGFKTLLVSTEMTRASINLRMDVILGHMRGFNLSHSAIRNGNEIDESEYKRFLTETDSKNLLICDHISGEDSISLPSINNLVRKYSPDLLVIDGVYLISQDSNKAAWEQSHSLFYGLKNLALSTNTAIMASTQATRDAADMYVPPAPSQVAFGDALIRASDVAVSMSMMKDDLDMPIADKRQIQFQKYRDGDLAFNDFDFIWRVNNGHIEQANA